MLRHAPRLALLTLLALLAACASRAPLPAHTPDLGLPLQLHIERLDEPAQWLLVIQAEGSALRWSLFDPLGVPLARQRLEDGTWQSEGLLPPNPQARELFAALLFALTPDAELAAAYPQAIRDGASRRLGDWQAANTVDSRLELRLGAQHYLIRTLQGGHH